ncbi:hypothetical protein C8Q80DRAFT_1265797 [Daedaleopsis nitida]|nr:hypothetical protein C8Q80DRAFT_1265797 [Daedaleopsis nitida]
MYLNTPNSGHSQRYDASQVPSTPTNAPRMGVRPLPPSPHTPNSPMPPYQARHAVAFHHYGLMTPPDSPEKPAHHGRGRTLDFHPTVDARGPPLSFDIRMGTHLSGTAAGSPAVNYPAGRLLVNIGPNAIVVEIVPSNGTTPTVSDVVGQLAYALKTRASPAEIANAVQFGLAFPHSIAANTTRAGLLSVKYTFAGFTLRSVQNGVAFVDCHLI